MNASVSLGASTFSQSAFTVSRVSSSRSLALASLKRNQLTIDVGKHVGDCPLFEGLWYRNAIGMHVVPVESWNSRPSCESVKANSRVEVVDESRVVALEVRDPKGRVVRPVVLG